jgi:hypothetical protein
MRGLDLFQERFAAFGDSYALIGGAACHLIFEDLGLPFRATKDLDIVLCAQVVDAGFTQALWAFIQDGGYEIRQRADGTPTYYRFAKPANTDFPYMLEIFARPSATLDLVPNQTIIPVTIEDGQYSLSAILLDEDYFGLLRGMTRRIDGVSVLDEYALIPFKAKAWMELSDRRDAGEEVHGPRDQPPRRDGQDARGGGRGRRLRHTARGRSRTAHADAGRARRAARR